MLNPLADLDVHVYSIPLRTRFRGITTREGVLFHGPGGWAEFSPFWDYDAAESAAWLRCALEAAGSPWVLGPDARVTIPMNVTVPAVAGERAWGIVADSGGCRTAKVKVAEPGQSLDDEIERLEAVRDALGPDGLIRIDANAGWTLEEALVALPALDTAAGGLDYAEQPCARVEDLATLRRRGDVRIAADESIRRANDPLRVARLEAADLVVLKVQPLGGIGQALEIADACGLPAIVSSALETSLGIAMGLRLAAVLPQLAGACGLATVHLLEGDVVDAPLLPLGGVIAVPPATGEAALAPNPALLEHHAATPARREAWLRRLDEVCHALV
ncbi:o-succinylbenzoate synthase [Micrococcales bacterium 31B]|nr:o-succinylbenzoate synthase [Micrococcales bacterium 31B]